MGHFYYVSAALPELTRGVDGDWYDVATGAFVFSPTYEIFQQAAVQTVTTTVFTNVLTGTTGALPTGLYRVEVSFGWAGDSATSDGRARFLVNGATPGVYSGDLIRFEEQDVAGNIQGTATVQAHAANRTFHLNLTGPTTFAVQAAHEANGNEMSVWDAEITCRRVQ